jgi:hemerythrin
MTEEQRKQYQQNYLRSTAQRVLSLTVQHFKDEEELERHLKYVKEMQESGQVDF